ncbi:MAG: hypothetical protein R2713_19365 [Ilumatobacteraceae bacterium]
MTDTDLDRFRTPEHLDRRARAGRAIRDIGHAVIGHHVDDELLDRVADQLESLTAELTTGPARGRQPGTFQSSSDDWAAPDDQMEFHGFDDRPVCGRSSPWGSTRWCAGWGTRSTRPSRCAAHEVRPAAATGRGSRHCSTTSSASCSASNALPASPAS